MKNQIKMIVENYFSEEDKYGQDYAISTLLHDIAKLADFDIDEYV